MPARRQASPSLLLLMLVIAGCGLRLPGAGSGDMSPSMSAVSTPSPTVAATPTAVPGPTLTVEPSPTPDPFVLDLDAFGCEGGVVLEWSPSADPDFHHYIALRSPERRISTKYPPIAPAVDWGDTYATDRFVTSAVDASILPSETPWHYRVMAYDARGRVIGASPVRIGRLRDAVNVGPLVVEAGPDETTRIGWIPYRGTGRCFSAYRVLFSIGGGPSTVLTVVSDQDARSIETAALHPGTTYQLRVQAVRTSLQGSFVLGQSDTVSYTVP
jgi:hypothetical protein